MVSLDGYLNTYSLTKDEKKITLAPLSPSQLRKPKPQKNQDQIKNSPYPVRTVSKGLPS